MDVYSNMPERQRQRLAASLKSIALFTSIVRSFPRESMPAEVTGSLIEAAEVAADYVIEVSAILTGLGEDATLRMVAARRDGLTFEEALCAMGAEMMGFESPEGEA